MTTKQSPRSSIGVGWQRIMVGRVPTWCECVVALDTNFTTAARCQVCASFLVHRTAPHVDDSTVFRENVISRAFWKVRTPGVKRSCCRYWKMSGNTRVHLLHGELPAFAGNCISPDARYITSPDSNGHCQDRLHGRQTPDNIRKLRRCQTSQIQVKIPRL